MPPRMLADDEEWRLQARVARSQSVRRRERCSPTWTSALDHSDNLIDSSRGAVITPGPVVNPLGTTEQEGRGERGQEKKKRWMNAEKEGLRRVQIRSNYFYGPFHRYKAKPKCLTKIKSIKKIKIFTLLWTEVPTVLPKLDDYCPSKVKSVSLAEHVFTIKGNPGWKEITKKGWKEVLEERINGMKQGGKKILGCSETEKQMSCLKS